MKTVFFHEGDLLYPLMAPVLGIDTETSGLKPHRDKLRLVQINDGTDIHIVRLHSTFPAGGPYNLIKTLANQSSMKIMHYARFDMGMVFHHLGVMMENVRCTKIMSKLVRTYTAHHGLASIYSDLINPNEKMDKTNATSNWSSTNLTPEQLEYAAKDVRYLPDIFQKLVDMFSEYPDRWEIAMQAFDFLPSRVRADLAGFDDMDIFSH